MKFRSLIGYAILTVLVVLAAHADDEPAPRADNKPDAEVEKPDTPADTPEPSPEPAPDEARAEDADSEQARPAPPLVKLPELPGRPTPPPEPPRFGFEGKSDFGDFDPRATKSTGLWEGVGASGFEPTGSDAYGWESAKGGPVTIEPGDVKPPDGASGKVVEKVAKSSKAEANPSASPKPTK